MDRVDWHSTYYTQAAIAKNCCKRFSVITAMTLHCKKMPDNDDIALLKISRFPHPDYPREAGKRENLFPRQKTAGLRSLMSMF